MLLRKRDVPQRSGHEQIRFAAAPNEITREFRTLPEHPLSGSGFMINIARVNIGAVVQKVAGDLLGAGKVQRCLPVATARMNKAWIRCKQFTKPIEKTEPGSRVNIDLRATFDSVMRHVNRSTVEHTKSTGPPVALTIQVRAEVQEQIEHRRTFRIHERR